MQPRQRRQSDPAKRECGQRHRRTAMQQGREPECRRDARRRRPIGIDRRGVQPERRRDHERRPAEPSRGRIAQQVPGGQPQQRGCARHHEHQRDHGATHTPDGERRRDEHRDADAVKRVVLTPWARVGVARLEAPAVEVGVGARVVVVAKVEVAVGDQAARDGQVMRRIAGEGEGRDRRCDAPEPHRRCCRGDEGVQPRVRDDRGDRHDRAEAGARGHRPGQEPTRAGDDPRGAQSRSEQRHDDGGQRRGDAPVAGRGEQAEQAERGDGARCGRRRHDGREAPWGFRHGRDRDAGGGGEQGARGHQQSGARDQPLSARHRDRHPLTTAAAIAGPAPRPPAGS